MNRREIYREYRRRRTEAAVTYAAILLAAGYTRRPVTRGNRYGWLDPAGIRAGRGEMLTLIIRALPPEFDSWFGFGDIWQLIAEAADRGAR